MRNSQGQTIWCEQFVFSKRKKLQHQKCCQKKWVYCQQTNKPVMLCVCLNLTSSGFAVLKMFAWNTDRHLAKKKHFKKVLQKERYTKVFTKLNILREMCCSVRQKSKRFVVNKQAFQNVRSNCLCSFVVQLSKSLVVKI